MTTLALTRAKQGGRLNVRQREGLRRALARAGEKLGWTSTAASREDPVAAVTKTVRKMVKSGARSLEREVADELAAKKTEEKRLCDIVEELRAIEEDPSIEFPMEISYTHTAKDATRGLVTHTETVMLESAKDAREQADHIEKRMRRWVKLRGEMLQELKARQKRLSELKGDVSDFVDSSKGLLGDILVTLP